MSKISKKFIEDNAVDGSKIRLSNAEALRARNAANNADVDVIKIDASDKIILGKLPVGPNANPPVEDAQLANKKYVDDEIAALGSGLEFQDSAIRIELDDSTIVAPSAGDRYLIDGVGINGFAGHDNAIAEFNGTIFTFKVPTTGTYISVDNVTDGIYYFGGTTWIKKQFEATTASTGLTKVGVDIRVDASLAGEGLLFSTGVLNVNPDGSTLEISSDALRIKDLGVTNAKLAGGITDAKLSSDYVQTSEVDNTTIEFTSAALKVKDLGISTDKIAASAVTKAKIGADVAGSGLGQNADGSLEVKVDGSSLEITTDVLNVKALGITDAMLAGSISDGKLASAFIKTSQVDGSSIEFTASALKIKANGVLESHLSSGIDAESFVLATGYASGSGVVAAADTIQQAIQKLDGNIKGSTLTPTKQVVVLTGTNITNGYVDLASEAVTGSVVMSVIGGPEQVEGSSYDYTLSVVALKTRITFQNDLATGGLSALVAGDVLSVTFMI